MECRNIYFDTLEEPLIVLNHLKQLINRFGQVTLAQYYDICDFKTDDLGTDIYGWRSLDRAGIGRVGQEYRISFPEVESLDVKEYRHTVNIKATKLYSCSNCEHSNCRGNIDGPCMNCVTNDLPYTQPTSWSAAKINRDSVTRNDILDKAKSIINGERQGTYGSPEDSFQVIADFWSAYLKKDLTPHDVANMMILLKIARNAGGVYKDDNWIDICGYAAIGGELQDRCNKEDG